MILLKYSEVAKHDINNKGHVRIKYTYSGKLLPRIFSACKRFKPIKMPAADLLELNGVTTSPIVKSWQQMVCKHIKKLKSRKQIYPCFISATSLFLSIT